MVFKSDQEYLQFLRATPVEPRQYIEPQEEANEEPDKKVKRKKTNNGEVL